MPHQQPFVPKGKVADVAVCGCCNELNQKLSELNINSIVTIQSEKIIKELNYHTDLYLFNHKTGEMLLDKGQNNNIVKFLTLGYKTKIINTEVT